MSLLLLTTLLLLLVSYSEAEYSSTDKLATYSDGNYTVRNNVWGIGAGVQELHITSFNNWYVHANHPNTSGVKAYAHVAKLFKNNVNILRTCISNFSVIVPNKGQYTTGYKIQIKSINLEVILWLNNCGAVEIRESLVGNYTLGGHMWNIYKGTDSSSHSSLLFVLNDGNVDTGRVDFHEIFGWMFDKLNLNFDASVGEIQFGFEITSSAGGLDFKVTNYELTC